MEHLKEKYESLEQRRKVEAQGYQTDVKILQDKLRHVEQKLVRATLAKVKGKQYCTNSLNNLILMLQHLHVCNVFCCCFFLYKTKR